MFCTDCDKPKIICPYYSTSEKQKIYCACKTKKTSSISISFRGKKMRDEHIGKYCCDIHSFHLCPIFSTVYAIEKGGSTVNFSENAKKEIKEIYGT